MLHIDVDGFRMPYIDVGHGPTVVLIHGSLGDFRVWMPLLGPLTTRYRVVAPSLRHFFPDHSDATAGTFTIAQHVRDVIAFIARLGGPVHLLGHSRGGHIAFRVALARPDLLSSVILAEPGGDLDASLAPANDPPRPSLNSVFVTSAEKIAGGDIDGGLAHLVDTIDGAGSWRGRAEPDRQEQRDNARTLLGQINEQRGPFTRADAERISVPALLIDGARSPAARNVPILHSAICGAERVTIPQASHNMFRQKPVEFCAAVDAFIARQPR